MSGSFDYCSCFTKTEREKRKNLRIGRKTPEWKEFVLRLDLSVVVLDVSLSEMWRRFVKFQVNVGMWETSAEGR